jgi:hypothetical protein
VGVAMTSPMTVMVRVILVGAMRMIRGLGET